MLDRAGINVSTQNEVLSFNSEPDGSPGPAQQAGVVKLSKILAVNGRPVKNKPELLRELKQLKAAGAEEVSFDFRLPKGASGTLTKTGSGSSSSGRSSTAATGQVGGGGKPPAGAAPRNKPALLTDALGKAIKAGDDGKGGLSDEFAEAADEHFVFQAGTTLRGGRYSKLAPLGSGVFARVVAAADGETSTTVAIKCLRRNARVAAMARKELEILR